METIQLPGSGRRTTRLAMGSSSLVGSTSRKEALALLETAFDAGIRHFDTAPSYGMGQSEGCVGEFLSRHKGEVTVTTKYGIPAPKGRSLAVLARGAVRPLIRRIPGFKKRLQSVARTAMKNSTPWSYTVEGAQATLENSLRALKTERIDVWLLHEATADDLRDDGLLRFMENNVRAGKIGTFGVGSAADKFPALLAERPAYCPVVQCEWNPLLPEGSYAGHFTVFHNVVKSWPARLAQRFAEDAELCRAWSDEAGVDLAAPGILFRLLMKAALLQNPDGIILFFSKKKRNIAGNAGIVSDASLDGAARVLLNRMRSEGAQG